MHKLGVGRPGQGIRRTPARIVVHERAGEGPQPPDLHARVHGREKVPVGLRLVAGVGRLAAVAVPSVGEDHARTLGVGLRLGPLLKLDHDEARRRGSVVSRNDEVDPPACRGQPVLDHDAGVVGQARVVEREPHRTQRIRPRAKFRTLRDALRRVKGTLAAREPVGNRLELAPKAAEVRAIHAGGHGVTFLPNDRPLSNPLRQAPMLFRLCRPP